MNNEKDKIGVNNDLPPMGTMIDNTSENKLNLPPISSFTNFGDSSISSDNNVSSNNANASIFNLMDQFDQVSSNNTNQSSFTQYGQSFGKDANNIDKYNLLQDDLFTYEELKNYKNRKLN